MWVKITWGEFMENSGVSVQNGDICGADLLFLSYYPCINRVAYVKDKFLLWFFYIVIVILTFCIFVKLLISMLVFSFLFPLFLCCCCCCLFSCFSSSLCFLVSDIISSSFFVSKLGAQMAFFAFCAAMLIPSPLLCPQK